MRSFIRRAATTKFNARGFSSSSMGFVSFGTKATTLGGLVASGLFMGWYVNQSNQLTVACAEKAPANCFKEFHLATYQAPQRKDLPVYNLKEVQKHSTEKDLWVTFKGGVYDVSKFANAHPGSMGRLLMAGGRDLEPFWTHYRMHLRYFIVDFLEQYRIGSLSSAESKSAADFTVPDAYSDDPPRHSELATQTQKPFSGETRLDYMVESYLTPNELFYVRNHAPVPLISDDEYELSVELPNGSRKTYSLAELKNKFPKHEVVATLQCAGNRAEDYNGIAAGFTKANFMTPHWAGGALSNAKWAGAKMRDVLKDAGLDVDGIADGTARVKPMHVLMNSYDAEETGTLYGASTFLDKVVDPFGDCLLAYEMNDQPMPRDHGAPIRGLIPGHAGARQPKWLNEIIIRERPYCVFQCLGMAPNLSFEKDLSNWPVEGPREPVQEMPVQSLICKPTQNATIGAKGGLDCVDMQGIAWSGGGVGIHRVDVSVDGGKKLEAAELFKPVHQHRQANYGWYQFSKCVELPDHVKADLKAGKKTELELTSKAVDAHFNVQPEFPGPYINPRGVAANHFYRVKTTLDPSIPKSVSNPSEELTKKGKFSNRPSGGKFTYPHQEHGWEASGDGKPNFKVSNAQNTKDEPGISDKINWNFYKNIKMKNYWEQ